MYLSDRNTRIASLIFNIFCVKSLLKKVVDPHVWSQARIRMHTDRRDRGERKKSSSRSRLRRSLFAANNSKKKPSDTQGIRGHAVPGNSLDFNSLRSPFISRDPKSFKQDIGQFYSPRIKPCNKLFSLLKIYLLPYLFD